MAGGFYRISRRLIFSATATEGQPTAVDEVRSSARVLRGPVTPMLSPRRPTLLPECRMCMSWFCASQIRSGHCRCRCPSPFLGNVSRLRSVHVPSHPPPTRTPVLRLPFFPSPDHHTGTPEYLQSSGLPPTFRENPRGLFFTPIPTALPSFHPNGESRLRLGVPIFPLGVPEAVSVVIRIHPVHAAGGKAIVTS